MFRIRAFGLDIYGCHEALARLDDFIDRELSPDEARKVTAHLRICRECASKFRFQEEMVAGLREKIARVETPQDAEIGALKNRISALLAQETTPDKPRED